MVGFSMFLNNIELFFSLVIFFHKLFHVFFLVFLLEQEGVLGDFFVFPGVF